MFPGCTVSDMRLRHEDLLREGGYEAEPRRADGEWFAGRLPRLDRMFAHWILSLLAILGYSITLR